MKTGKNFIHYLFHSIEKTDFPKVIQAIKVNSIP